ncbi:hypothetical protein [Rhodospira trueperi]|uniref:Uncharacterized protein n=1 Tax=Rhodospira trueperi TaxID=69960 RepID=A0A1G7GWV5_9PROT|nr:hypothetical protein [Rhodospira trueperi]SDE92627.1 hypothetical protein SAMN05421720_11636 [Rhodospira trueperi]
MCLEEAGHDTLDRIRTPSSRTRREAPGAGGGPWVLLGWAFGVLVLLLILPDLGVNPRAGEDDGPSINPVGSRSGSSG